MRALLSFEQAPPIDVPLRFLFSAVPFGIAAGLLLIFSGEALASRWSAESLALVHLLTVGFMLQAMSGAMLQLTPVAIGATVWRPRLIATFVHSALLLGGICLATAFLSGQRWQFLIAIIALLSGVAVFATSVLVALARTPARNESRRAMQIAVASLILTAIVGAALAADRAGHGALPPELDTTIHLRFGWVGWGLALLCGASYLVVPMFQLTPQYPAWFQRIFAPGLLGALVAVTIFLPEAWGNPLLALAVASFALMTLRLQFQRKRPRIDTSFRFWRVGLLSALAAALITAMLPSIGEAPQLEVLIGVLVLLGGFVSVICAMMYKIIPFLVWLHLNNAGAEALLMHQVIEEGRMRHHFRLHLAALLFAVASPWYAAATVPAGVLLAIAHVVQGINLLRAWSRYQERIRATRSGAVARGPGQSR